MLFTVQRPASPVEIQMKLSHIHVTIPLYGRRCMCHTHSSQQWGNWWVVKNWWAMYCSFHVAHVWEHLIACSQLAVVDWRQQKTERPAEEMEREREGERAWVKVIIWITAGNWITLHRGKLIGQKWVEMKLDGWVHILHTSQWALPVGFQLNFCE